MSSQRGNVSRTRTQKHQNRSVFRNDRHDTNIRTKRINQTQIVDVCAKCKAILEWKIKYKKYKMLTVPRSCNRCHEKIVKLPYRVVCITCAHQSNVCPKCEAPMSNNKKNDCEQTSLVQSQIEESDTRSVSEESNNGNSYVSSDELPVGYVEKMSRIIINSH